MRSGGRGAERGEGDGSDRKKSPQVKVSKQAITNSRGRKRLPKKNLIMAEALYFMGRVNPLSLDFRTKADKSTGPG